MGFIFESEIAAIMNTVRARTIGEEDSVRLSTILGADVHPAIKAYFKAEVEKLLQKERGKETRSPRFSYGLAEVKELQRQIDLALVHQYEFDRLEFESILDESVHFQFNYLCRPRWTLQEFVFEGRRKASLTEVFRKLKYCVEYRYLPEIFKRYVNERGLAEIDYEEFRTLVERIEAEVIGNHSSAELSRVLKPLVDFIEMGIPETRISQSGPVLPINAAIVFFEDKKLDEIRAALEEDRDRHGVREVSINDLVAVIRRTRGESEQSLPQQVPLGADSKRDGPATESSKVAVTEDSLDPAVALKTDESDSGDDVMTDIYSLFTVREQRLFVRKLFRKDEVEFRQALDQLNAIGTWKQASLVLDEIFSAHDVDPFSKEAVLFTDKVYSRYSLAEQARK